MRIEAVKEALTEFLNDIRKVSDFDCPLTDSQIITLIEFMMINNLIIFDEKVYIQRQGAIMGDNMAPALANLYMLHLHKKHFRHLNITSTDSYTSEQSHLRTNETTMQPQPYINLLFKSYIDDILHIIAIHKTADCNTYITQFITKYNTMERSINIKCTDSRVIQTVNFLDINIRVTSENTLALSTYSKEYSSFCYINFQSLHPISVFKGFIIGELYRYITHSSNEIIYKETKEKFYNRLIKRNYPKELLNQIFNEFPYNSTLRNNIINNTNIEKKNINLAKFHNKFTAYSDNKHNINSSRLTQLIERSKDKINKETNIIPLIIPYHPTTSKINFNQIIRTNSQYNNIPTDISNNIKVTYSCAPNIQSLLIRSKL